VINRRKDGAIYHEEMRIAPLRDSKGEPSGYIAIKRNVTRQRADQEAQAFVAAIVENSEDAGDWQPVIARMDELERQFSLLKNVIEANEKGLGRFGRNTNLATFGTCCYESDPLQAGNLQWAD